MLRASKWPAAPEARPAARGGLDARHLQCLVASRGGNEPGQALGQQCLSRAGRPDHEQPMPARRGNFQRAFGAELTAHLGEIRERIADAGAAKGRAASGV